ncbi:uncharacterized protein LOC119389343 isoform X5 [Rhipicephalus sanguineus]|uniref:uncharacterized protein LOC119389343 isoform X5 n=1 Tax=Rhipicephalus sanguineus TaxID=34632 RepID=UPI0020C3181E|nr:uncharacterized protein LOC119389343 isoform X5 [Rhipicephalus sanguineus]
MHGAVDCKGVFSSMILAQSIGIWVVSHGYERTRDVDPWNPADVPYRFMGKHGARMGVISQDCDDGQYRIDVDYGGSPEEYTCTMKDLLWYVTVGGWYHSTYKCNRVKNGYRPYHYCMNKRIIYSDAIPTHEGHRPLWPVYGEYKYVPPQRWLHSIEPLALVAWGCKLQMSHVNAREVIKFIKEHALRGPEGRFPMEGQYSYMLIAKAHPPSGSDMNDANLCPALHEYTRLQTTF